MPMRREQVAAALRYLGDKADLRRRAERMVSLDPQEQDLADIAVETGASFVPGVGQALAARDVERARRANDPAGMAMAAASAIPGERLAKLLKGFDPTRLELDVYHGTPHRFPATETVNVYRGENAANMGGNYWSTNPEFAQQFTQRGLPEEVKRSTLSMSDVYSPPTPVFAGDAKAVDAAIAEAKKLGKSAVRFSEGKNQPDSFFVIEKAALGRKGNPLGEFDASKIGTGEGAQAYGHGIYYAESPDIAKHYQTQLGKFYDQMQTPEGAMSLEEAVTKYHPDGKIAAKVLSTFRTKTDVDTFNKVINDEILPEIRAKYPQSEWGKFAPQQGTLYKADLPDEMIDRMLDWDKPLSEQRELATPILKELGYLRPNDDGPRQFSQAVKALALEHGGFGESGATGMALFNAIYKGLQQGKPKTINLAKRMNLNEQEMFMEASPLASEVMKRMGIPGIKYLDAGSRGQGGSGTRNFVVFPGEEKKVRILERK